MCDIPFDRSFLQLSNGIRHVMPSTDKARINSKCIDGSARLTAGCICQWVNSERIGIQEFVNIVKYTSNKNCDFIMFRYYLWICKC
jgi:hypothetical protein